jgi:hypothetical protein
MSSVVVQDLILDFGFAGSNLSKSFCNSFLKTTQQK